jgi:hypothetical protein
MWPPRKMCAYAQRCAARRFGVIFQRLPTRANGTERLNAARLQTNF